MELFDSLLFGNGLTISVLSLLKKHSKNPRASYLNCDFFISEFCLAEPHKRIVRKFHSCFGKTHQAQQNLEDTRLLLRSKLEDINRLGFERWVSQDIFRKDSSHEDIKMYTYLLYNYWYHVINEIIISNQYVQKLLERYVYCIKSKLIEDPYILTTNFENLLDSFLSPQHIHGKFILPFEHVADTILHNFSDEQFEFTYLFGTNGYEKHYRIERISKLKQKFFDLEFFNTETRDFGNLLIFGLAFGKSDVLSEGFLIEYPEHKNNSIALSVDGHIISRLEQIHEDGNLSKVYISCYSDNDRENYKKIFSQTKLEPVIIYINCSEVCELNGV